MIWKKRGNARNITEVIQENSSLKLKEVAFPADVPPSLIVGIDEAAEMINHGVKDSMKITIVGDYDADGITASAILWFLLRYLGTSPTIRLPKRYSEGYGMSDRIVEEIEEGLILTVDNGISAVQEIKKAKTKGLTVIVLDHHLAGDTLPLADILVDPHIAPNENAFSDYCGAGLAFKLVQALVDDEEFIKRMSALAAIGTVADVVPLVGDNRIIVKNGLACINRRELPVGLLALLRAAGYETVDEQTLGFVFGPLLNAAGRLLDDGAMISFKVLVSEKYEEAEKRAYELVKLNQQRKRLQKEGMIRAYELLEKEERIQAPICIYDPNLLTGIAGLVAGRLSEEFQVPAFVFTKANEEGLLKGSGRSYGGIHLKKLLDRANTYLESYGGHEGAAGVSIRQALFQDFKSILEKELCTYKTNDKGILFYDLEVHPEEVSAVIEDINRYAPYGSGNPRPIIRVDNIIPLPAGGKTFRTMGENNEHIRMTARGFLIVAFNKSQEFNALGDVDSINVVGYLSKSSYMGNIRIEIEALDFTGNYVQNHNSVLQQRLLNNCKDFGKIATGGEA